MFFSYETLAVQGTLPVTEIPSVLCSVTDENHKYRQKKQILFMSKRDDDKLTQSHLCAEAEINSASKRDSNINAYLCGGDQNNFFE